MVSPALPRASEPNVADEVLAEINDPRVAVRVIFCGANSMSSRTGGPSCGTSVTECSSTTALVQAESSKVGRSQCLTLLRRHDLAPLLVGADDFARAGFPGIIGGDDVGRAVGVSDFELGAEERACVPYCARPIQPRRPAYQPSPSTAPTAFSPGRISLVTS